MTSQPVVALGMSAVQTEAHARRGIGRYATQYAGALARHAPELIASVDVLDQHQFLAPSELDPRLVRGGEECRRRPVTKAPLIYHVLSAFEFTDFERVWPEWARAPDIALVVTLYDVIPLEFDQRYLHSSGLRLWYHTRTALLRNADAVLAISDASAASAVSLAGISERRVHVVGAAAAVRHSTPRLSSARGPVLTVTGDDDRKNTERLVLAYARLPASVRKRHPLVIVGLLGVGRILRLRRLAWRHHADRHIFFTGEITDHELSELYRSAAVTVFPSLAEGFGLPVLESLATGCVTLCSDIPPLREIQLDAHARFDPLSPAAISEVLLRGLRDEGFRARMIHSAASLAARHTWARVVDLSLEAYSSAARRRLGAKTPLKRQTRLAFISPFPPTPSGVARYSERLAEALSGSADVQRYADTGGGGQRSDLRSPADVGWHTALTSRPTERLYCLGASPYHVDTLAEFLRHPGDVLLHEVWLVPLYQALEQSGHPDGVLAHHLKRAEDVGIERLFDNEVTMVGDIVDRARLVFVHSHAARRLVLEKRPSATDKVVVLPFGHPAPNPTGSERMQAVVAVFGHLKAPEHVVAALTSLLRERRELRLWFVGGDPLPGDGQRLAELVARYGLSAQVRITGWAEDGVYMQALREATLAIQLRRRFFGERSAAIADCLAAGVPTIVNEIGATAELPTDTVVKLKPWPSSNELREAVRLLLDSPETRAAISSSAREYAAANSMQNTATTLLKHIVG